MTDDIVKRLFLVAEEAAGTIESLHDQVNSKEARIDVLEKYVDKLEKDLEVCRINLASVTKREAKNDRIAELELQLDVKRKSHEAAVKNWTDRIEDLEKQVKDLEALNIHRCTEIINYQVLVTKLQAKAIRASWANDVDRQGGSFTAQEIEDRKTWR